MPLCYLPLTIELSLVGNLDDLVVTQSFGAVQPNLGLQATGTAAHQAEMIEKYEYFFADRITIERVFQNMFKPNAI